MEVITKKYEDLLTKNSMRTKPMNMCIGFMFGLAEGLFIATFAYLFYFGGKLLDDSFDDEENDFVGIKADQVFMCIFATAFASIAAGSAGFFGPDVKESRKAAQNVFEILEYPSKIDAVSMNDNANLKMADDTFEGRIEFKNVWFRYPYAPDEFILRGTSFKIDSMESVGIVGQFGSGKSAIVDLLMRFYDPDFGEIMIDGVSIQSYNL